MAGRQVARVELRASDRKFGSGSLNGQLQRGPDTVALEAFNCPVLPGDLADFNGVRDDANMLAPEMIPGKETVEKLNARIAEWAKEHMSVVVVPVKEMFRKLHAGEAIDVRGNTFEEDELRAA